ncbi:glycoside hydrolase family 97 protein [Luteimonas kalidii]|uniref:Glycoside hydrolase family 97 protein n=1 Tax=Luteimonas kalidii TaxID=3042025 RepID=A0ABT6JV67_9GAMM|nr:glycoside hydrolase family 97 protein [Luteimonas kalidii]MDH5834588.1 glycoside hydrolase family 97 protein [Luteimonas kalidii]
MRGHVTSLLLSLLAVAGLAHAEAAAPLELHSPAGTASASLTLDDAGQPRLSVSWRDEPVLLPSPLGVQFSDDRLERDLRITGRRTREHDARYAFVAGKASEGRDHYRELEVDMADAQGRTLGLVLRAYDDGIAFRYRLPLPPRGDLLVRQDLTGYLFPRDYRCWSFNVGRFNTPHEGEFDPIQASKIRPMHLIDLPLVCGTGRGQATFAIAEADLDRYAAFYLSGRGDGRLGLDTRLSPRHDTPEFAVRIPRAEVAAGGHLTPWRVVMLGDSPGALVESNLIAHLNPPTPIEDTSWIVPGKSAWDWWSGSVAPDVPEPGMNTATMRRYIDHAADMGLEYMLIDAGWYPGSSGGDLWEPSADASRPIPELDLPALLAHARERGVGIWLWVHFKALDTRMDELFALYRDWGVKGVKIDYMDRNDQQMVAFFHRMMRSAAEHRLMLDLHGAYRPTGLNRTWPHFLTQEGVLGAEYNKWSRRVTPTHNVTIPFTRMLVGPIDYTPGGFRNVAPEDFGIAFTRPQVMGTRAHQLAMFVVYDSPLQMVADSPDVYVDAPGADFLGLVPTTWDETRVLSGAIGEHVAIARRSGHDWYVGAMTNESPRTLELDLAFLGDGRFRATLWEDGDVPTDVQRSEREVRAGQALALRLAAGGGAALKLSPAASRGE